MEVQQGVDFSGDIVFSDYLLRGEVIYLLAQVDGASGGHAHDSAAIESRLDAAGVYGLGLVNERPDEVKARGKDAMKAPEALDDACLGLRHHFDAGKH